jgi:hypothetical protein
MSNKRHKRRPPNEEPTATFEELSFAEQSKSITAITNVLGRTIDSNVRRATQENRNPDETRRKRLDQVQRMINRKK